ncbi:type 2 lanthipeptide synthetase LanM family protein [Roseovarius aestuarii]|uniref:Lanthionine synthetase C-like protein n=1 Tax=Roseovarius aestuarii TaxID=475083 RepID=A0A1X7BTB7_9RHOB|nr:type 2 lanthipeptide synthetase LanM family protein [Roseovarius aestuarii]SMC12867.1 Lanthionine synthetase C-like protein [Roseovarius aestuarii]
MAGSPRSERAAATQTIEPRGDTGAGETAPGDRDATASVTHAWMLEAVRAGREPDGKDSPPAQPGGIPFEDLLLPVARAARRRRSARFGEPAAFVEEAALQGLDKILFFRLSDLVAPTLLLGFSLYRLVREPNALSHGIPVPCDPASTRVYDAYVSALRDGRIADELAERPVLAELWARITNQWIEATGEFLMRLAADRETISATFLDGRGHGRVTSVEGGLSDPHCGGRIVLKVTYNGGQSIGYKPRDLSLDVAWRDFRSWLDSQGAPSAIRAPEVLARDGYGWVEWIEARPCANRDEANCFFERGGAVLCLLHLLRGADLHFENVIASGDWPVPVDLETLFQPVPRGDPATCPAGSAIDLAAQWVRDSVLSTGFLPRWLAVPGGHLLAVGGLFSEAHTLSPHRRFTHVNTDAMDHEPVQVRPPEAGNAATLDGTPLAAGAFTREILNGYARMYRFLLDRRAAFLADDGPLAGFRGRPVRVVLRPTVLYASLLRRATGPGNLRDWQMFRAGFGLLARQGSFTARDRVVADEIGGMEYLDIPYFTTRTDSTALVLSDGQRIGNFFRASAFDDAVGLAARMSEEHLSDMLGTIAAALTPQDSLHVSWPIAGDSASRAAGGDMAADVARDLFEKLEAAVIRGHDGTIWIGAVPLGRGARSQIEPVGFDLYSGTTGIALFFAACFKTQGIEQARQAALSALAPLRAVLRDPERRKRLVDTMGIGGLSGAGSLIYAFTCIADLVGDAGLLDEAGTIAREIRLERIELDRVYDVVGGVAGAGLALLALHRETGEAWLLERAYACGAHLVASTGITDTGHRAWVGVNDRALTGVSHGASGIALALSRLGAVCGEASFRAAACEGLDFEDALFSEQAGNWPDRRTEGADAGGFAYQWCHGAPGIALVRSELYTQLGRPQESALLDAALETTERSGAAARDHLCCGTFGRIDVLLTCGLRLGRAELADRAVAMSRDALHAARRRGGFAYPNGAGAFAPGFFCGRAGIGYQLLRLGNPDALRSILAWD